MPDFNPFDPSQVPFQLQDPLEPGSSLPGVPHTGGHMPTQYEMMMNMMQRQNANSLATYVLANDPRALAASGLMARGLAGTSGEQWMHTDEGKLTNMGVSALINSGAVFNAGGNSLDLMNGIQNMVGQGSFGGPEGGVKNQFAAGRGFVNDMMSRKLYDSVTSNFYGAGGAANLSRTQGFDRGQIGSVFTELGRSGAMMGDTGYRIRETKEADIAEDLSHANTSQERDEIKQRLGKNMLDINPAYAKKFEDLASHALKTIRLLSDITGNTNTAQLMRESQQITGTSYSEDGGAEMIRTKLEHINRVATNNGFNGQETMSMISQLGGGPAATQAVLSSITQLKAYQTDRALATAAHQYTPEVTQQELASTNMGGTMAVINESPEVMAALYIAQNSPAARGKDKDGNDAQKTIRDKIKAITAAPTMDAEGSARAALSDYMTQYTGGQSMATVSYLKGGPTKIYNKDLSSKNKDFATDFAVNEDISRTVKINLRQLVQETRLADTYDLEGETSDKAVKSVFDTMNPNSRQAISTAAKRGDFKTVDSLLASMPQFKSTTPQPVTDQNLSPVVQNVLGLLPTGDQDKVTEAIKHQDVATVKKVLSTSTALGTEEQRKTATGFLTEAITRVKNLNGPEKDTAANVLNQIATNAVAITPAQQTAARNQLNTLLKPTVNPTIEAARVAISEKISAAVRPAVTAQNMPPAVQNILGLLSGTDRTKVVSAMMRQDTATVQQVLGGVTALGNEDQRKAAAGFLTDAVTRVNTLQGTEKEAAAGFLNRAIATTPVLTTPTQQTAARNQLNTLLKPATNTDAIETAIGGVFKGLDAPTRTAVEAAVAKGDINEVRAAMNTALGFNTSAQRQAATERIVTSMGKHDDTGTTATIVETLYGTLSQGRRRNVMAAINNNDVAGFRKAMEGAQGFENEDARKAFTEQVVGQLAKPGQHLGDALIQADRDVRTNELTRNIIGRSVEDQIDDKQQTTRDWLDQNSFGSAPAEGNIIDNFIRGVVGATNNGDSQVLQYMENVEMDKPGTTGLQRLDLVKAKDDKGYVANMTEAQAEALSKANPGLAQALGVDNTGKAIKDAMAKSTGVDKFTQYLDENGYKKAKGAEDNKGHSTLRFATEDKSEVSEAALQKDMDDKAYANLFHVGKKDVSGMSATDLGKKWDTSTSEIVKHLSNPDSKQNAALAYLVKKDPGKVTDWLDKEIKDREQGSKKYEERQHKFLGNVRAFFNLDTYGVDKDKKDAQEIEVLKKKRTELGGQDATKSGDMVGTVKMIISDGVLMDLYKGRGLGN